MTKLHSPPPVAGAGPTLQMMRKKGGGGAKEGKSAKGGGVEIDWDRLAQQLYNKDTGCAFMSISTLTGQSGGQILQEIVKLAGGDLTKFDEDQFIFAYIGQTQGFTPVAATYGTLAQLIAGEMDGDFLVSVGQGSSGHMLTFTIAKGKVTASYDTTTKTGNSKGDLIKDWGWQKVMAAWKYG